MPWSRPRHWASRRSPARSQRTADPPATAPFARGMSRTRRARPCSSQGGRLGPSSQLCGPPTAASPPSGAPVLRLAEDPRRARSARLPRGAAPTPVCCAFAQLRPMQPCASAHPTAHRLGAPQFPVPATEWVHTAASISVPINTPIITDGAPIGASAGLGHRPGASRWLWETAAATQTSALLSGVPARASTT